jgi:hypothetical protein
VRRATGLAGRFPTPGRGGLDRRPSVGAAGHCRADHILVCGGLPGPVDQSARARRATDLSLAASPPPGVALWTASHLRALLAAAAPMMRRKKVVNEKKGEGENDMWAQHLGVH